MDVEALRDGLAPLLFERVNPAKDERRFYYLVWQPTILDGWAVVRVFGRRGVWQRALPPLPFDSLEEAWPTIRAIIRRRLRHGYRIATL